MIGPEQQTRPDVISGHVMGDGRWACFDWVLGSGSRHPIGGSMSVPMWRTPGLWRNARGRVYSAAWKKRHQAAAF